MKSKVYYCEEVDSKKLVEIYQKLNVNLSGKIAVKVHSGEEGNQNYLRPSFMKELVEYLHGTIVECNTAYAGERNTTEKHLKTLKKHGWNDLYDVDLMDADGEISLPIKKGKHLQEDLVGKNIVKYDSMLVLSHFKGHPMGGYGGALKQLSIGCASSNGKALIHSAGTNKDQYTLWDNLPSQNDFLESMAEAAKAVVDHFSGKMFFINVMANMSVDCDCCSVAEDPCLHDMGILFSDDPVAIDMACLDLVRNSSDPGREHFMERVNSRNGLHTIYEAEKLGVGNKEYELIRI